MGYVVGERGVKYGGKRLVPGTPLPDSIERDWHNFQAYLDGGFVEEVDDEAVEPEPEPEPEVEQTLEYTCDECDYIASSPQGLGAHSRVHKAEEPEDEEEDDEDPPEDDDSPPEEGEEE